MGKRLPHGFGGVTRLSGSRSKPYGAYVTTGYTDDNKQIRKAVGYYKTKKEAIEALAKYNADPYDLQIDSITFSALYDKWSEEHFKTIVPSAARTWKSAYNYCKPLYNKKMKEIRTIDLEHTIEIADVGQNTKARMKSMFNLMYKYAMRYEIVDKDYAALCKSVAKPKAEIVREPFSAEEEQLLWDNIDFPFVDMILIGIYSGWRPQELSILKIEDINLEENTMRGGLKTDAGINRIVPIHPKIRPLIEKRYNPENEYLFNDENGQQGTSMTYDKYRGRWKKIMTRLKIDHKPHDTRHTFITKAKVAGMDEYILKIIVGHTISDITEKTYTHRTMEQLQEEINKIL